MDASELKAELSIRMIELERAIDNGMPYPELKKIYNQIKELQYQVAFELSEAKNKIGQEDTDFVIE